MEGNNCSQTVLVFILTRLSTTPTIVGQSTAKMRALVLCLVASASTEVIYTISIFQPCHQSSLQLWAAYDAGRDHQT